MNNTFLRSLIIYAACVVLAVWLGFLLAGPLTYSSLFIYGGLAFLLISPVLLRWHYPLMVLSLNMAVTIFFLPGSPTLALCTVCMSLAISILQRMVSRDHSFIRVPQITLPLIVMLAVIAVTAKMTGFGLHAFGNAVYGGKKYVYLVIGILAYFALSAYRIPPERRNLYLGLYFLGGLTFIIGDLVPLLPHSLYYIFWVFQPDINFFQNMGPNSEATRLNGMWQACQFIFAFMLARYGIRGIFLSGKPWRWILMSIVFPLGLFGGFRVYIANCGLVFLLQFFLERLHRTKLMAVLAAAGIFGALALIPLSDHLPYTFQRALSFLPYKISSAAKMDAQASADWRFEMWQGILPQIPQYLLLGRGYTISTQDYDFLAGGEIQASVRNTFAGDQWAALASDFHNGPLSVVIPFGIWGLIAFLCFIFAALRVLYLNYRYSPPELRTLNSFCLAFFASRTIIFLFVGGFLHVDILTFCGLLGLNVSLNGGVRRRVVAARPVREPERPRGFVPVPTRAPAFQRRLGRAAS